MACINEVTRERAASAAEFENEPGSLTHRLQQRKDAGGAGVGVEAEAQVVHHGEISAVVRLASSQTRMMAGAP
jgi:hypothetical protein